ncbi:GIY-YIG nuclease family protein [Candidatus Kuenenbacteria bacterium]|nr:GIY-YIG nuclease family protein [Candidatus Kuenenbacteria bacterium]
MFHVYVLQSEKDKTLYIGMTEDISKRLSGHNRGKTKSTKARVPYKLIYSEIYQTKTDALRRERQIKKSGKVRSELKAGIYSGPIV